MPYTLYFIGMKMQLTDWVGLLGLIFGLLGTIISVINWWNDKAKIKVLLQWDMADTSQPDEYRCGLITITNVGRRPAFVSHVALSAPQHEVPTLLLRDTIRGTVLAEGSQPYYIPVDYDGLESYANYWQDMIAQVADSTGAVWKSKPVKEKPSWAKK